MNRIGPGGSGQRPGRAGPFALGRTREGGMTGDAGASGRGKYRPYKRVSWTAAMQEGFLDHLSATCSVRAAAEQIGVGISTAYYRRRVDGAFADAWSHALRLGYEALELRLVGRALGGAARVDDDLDVDLTVRILGQRRAGGRTVMSASPAGRPGGRPAHRLTSHELEAMLLKRIAAFAPRGDADGQGDAGA